MSNTAKQTKAQRLELNGYIAPVLRSASEPVKKRRWTAYNQETGENTRVVDGTEVLRGLAKVQELESAVVEGERPKTVVCQNCGRLITVRPYTRLPTRCEFDGCAQRTCAGYDGMACNVKPNKDAFNPLRVAKRVGEPWRCYSCAMRKAAPLVGSQLFCAGHSGVECKKPCKARHNTARGLASRNGNPWRCFECHFANKAAHLENSQSNCAGYAEFRCSAPPPPTAFLVARVRARGGRPWRCRSCSSKHLMLTCPAALARNRDKAVKMREKIAVEIFVGPPCRTCGSTERRRAKPGKAVGDCRPCNLRRQARKAAE